jgi:hypothetical protein
MISSFFTSYNKIHTQSFAKKEIEEEVKAATWGIDRGDCLEHADNSFGPRPLIHRYQQFLDIVDDAVFST